MNKKLKYSQTQDLGTLKEIQQWEKERNSAYITDDMGGYIEIVPTRSLNDDGSHGNEEFLFMVAVNQTAENEIDLLFSSREEIIKLRDYLNRFLQKTEFWVK